MCGGSIPVFDEIILSLKNLNNIIKFDKQNSIITC